MAVRTEGQRQYFSVFEIVCLPLFPLLYLSLCLLVSEIVIKCTVIDHLIRVNRTVISPFSSEREHKGRTVWVSSEIDFLCTSASFLLLLLLANFTILPSPLVLCVCVCALVFIVNESTVRQTKALSDSAHLLVIINWTRLITTSTDDYLFCCCCCCCWSEIFSCFMTFPLILEEFCWKKVLKHSVQRQQQQFVIMIWLSLKLKFWKFFAQTYCETKSERLRALANFHWPLV